MEFVLFATKLGDILPNTTDASWVAAISNKSSDDFYDWEIKATCKKNFTF